jgi:predicted nuclease of predicted toxin-antitoxin system
MPGADDDEIVARAIREARILLTFDKDFGELAWRAGASAMPGVVLFRLPLASAADVGEILAGRLGERTDWAGHFSVIEAGRVRMRPLAKA